jgi:hypothetical protein
LTIAAKPSASPGPTHQLKTSTLVAAGAAAGVHAESTIAALITTANKPYKYFLDIVFFSFYMLKRNQLSGDNCPMFSLRITSFSIVSGFVNVSSPSVKLAAIHLVY